MPSDPSMLLAFLEADLARASLELSSWIGELLAWFA